MSAHIAFKKATNNTNIFFCMFHFSQCVWRKIQKLGLVTNYLNDADFMLYVKCINSLAFVPPENVVNEFTKLKTKSA